MKRMLINAAQSEELRVALVQDHILYDLIVERAGFEQKVGNIYKAKITSIEPSLDAVFIDYGSERHGFLPVKEISPEYYLKPVDPHSNQRLDLREILKVGQELTIQVEKEERGNKGAALTTFISLAGSYLVLMPNNPRAGGISRRIEGDDRDELRENISSLNIPEDMGIIVRTAGVGKSREELQWDLDVLLSHWAAIEAASTQRKAPFLIHQEGDLVIRAIRDYLRADISELWIDNKEIYEKAHEYISQVRPDFIPRLKFYEQTVPLFTQYQVEHQIETAYKRTVQLKSGGSVVIDHTEALVAIDINSAGSTKGSNIEATALHTNLEAAEEIARQLRLRDIGGLIVIDFIDMLQSRHQRDVENALFNNLRLDRARVQIAKISRFGLLELSRQRLRPSLREAIQNVCPTCNGHGSVRSVESVALTILRIIEEESMKPNTSEIEVQASSDTATYLLNEKRQFIMNLEKQHKTNVFIIPNPNYDPHQYNIKRLRRTDSEAGEKHKPSYQHLKQPDVDFSASRQAHTHRPHNQPAVKNVLTSRPDLEGKQGQSGIIKRLWSSVFGAVDDDGDTSSDEGSSGSSDRTRNTKARAHHSKNRERSNTKQSRGRKPRGHSSDNQRNNDQKDQQRTSSRRRSPEKSDRRHSGQDNQDRRGPAKRTSDQNRDRSGDRRDDRRPAKRPNRRDAEPKSGQRSTASQQSKPAENQYQAVQDQPPLKIGPVKTQPTQEKKPTKSAKPVSQSKTGEGKQQESNARRPRRVQAPTTEKQTTNKSDSQPTKDHAPKSADNQKQVDGNQQQARRPRKISQASEPKQQSKPKSEARTQPKSKPKESRDHTDKPAIQTYEQEQTGDSAIKSQESTVDDKPLVVRPPKSETTDTSPNSKKEAKSDSDKNKPSGKTTDINNEEEKV